MFSFQNHSRRMDFRVNISFRITACFTLYTLWKPRILSKHAISVFANAPQKRTDKAMIFIDFWHFPISQKWLLAIPQLFIARKCREFFASSVGFEMVSRGIQVECWGSRAAGLRLRTGFSGYRWSLGTFPGTLIGKNAKKGLACCGCTQTDKHKKKSPQILRRLLFFRWTCSGCFGFETLVRNGTSGSTSNLQPHLSLEGC